MAVAGVLLFGDLDKGLDLQPGGMAHGGDLHHHRRVIQQGDFHHAGDHRACQTGHDGNRRAQLDHDERPLKAGGNFAQVHPHVRQLLQRGALTGREKAVHRAGVDHALAFQVFEMKGFPLRQGAVGIHQHMIPQGKQGAERDVRVLGVLRSIKEADVQLARAELLQGAAVVLGDDVHVGVGILVLELGHDPRKGGVVEQLAQPHHQMGAVRRLDVLDLFHRLAVETEHLDHIQIEGLARCREPGAAGGPLKEFEPGLLFQGADLVGDGGLGGEQPVGRRAEIQLFRHRNKALQLVNCHRNPPSWEKTLFGTIIQSFPYGVNSQSIDRVFL